MIKKIVEPTGDLCIKFTEEELNKLGIKEGDKFSYEEHDGGFLLRKYESIEIDFSDFSKETLQFLITYSVDNNLTIEEAIENPAQPTQHFLPINIPGVSTPPINLCGEKKKASYLEPSILTYGALQAKSINKYL